MTAQMKMKIPPANFVHKLEGYFQTEAFTCVKSRGCLGCLLKNGNEISELHWDFFPTSYKTGGEGGCGIK